jgi:hypothetical protein
MPGGVRVTSWVRSLERFEDMWEEFEVVQEVVCRGVDMLLVFKLRCVDLGPSSSPNSYGGNELLVESHSVLVLSALAL